ncbi:Brp/Blh family beta-carotene 15,15'-dioxygenase [Balneola sp. MJW-20]|uniref:Brp/Blh family beta-carotene 15,15'-dioxygenase n=1 Tax=Gracilimonas aurantiaca TaxID=3234185 RepID=UPI0034657895
MIQNKVVFIQCIFGLLAILINFLFPEFVEDFRYYLLGIAILLTGMPHGAIDHIISFELNDHSQTIKNNLQFYGSYLGLIIIYSLLWIYFPMFSFISFMLITLYHFGQADAMRFDLEPFWRWAIHLSRGITVVGLILFANPDYTSPVIESVTGISIAQVVTGFLSISVLKTGLALCYPVMFIITSLFQYHRFSDFTTALLDAAVVSLLFFYCDTIWAFSIYFGIWHAFNHIRVMIRFMRLKGTKAGWIWFYKKSFLYSFLSYLGIALLYFILDAFGSEELLVFLLFIAISVMTLPHMLIVEKMYGMFGKSIAGPEAEAH